MSLLDGPADGCRPDRAPLKRLGKIRHECTGKCVYVLLCTECGFTVTTEELRRLREGATADAGQEHSEPNWGTSTS